MENISTKYGDLKGATHVSFYPKGNIRECILTEANEIETPYGKFIPQYMDDGFRRKLIKPVIFHENGNLKNLPLQEKVEIQTTVGLLPAELITWYEDGSIRRIFPLDGKITGFWSEEDEYDLSKTLEFNFPFGKIEQKVVAIQFYRNGAVKSITLWPKDTITISSPIGVIEARIGFNLYPDGKLKSFEPSQPLLVDTPIGKIKAYDRTAIGIHSDSNSIRFTETGEIGNVVTGTEMVKVIDKNGKEYIYNPHLKPSMFNLDVMDLIPLSIQFHDKKVRFNNNSVDEFNLDECSFTVSSFVLKDQGICSSCNDCTACGGMKG